MDSTLISNWNETVKQDDDVYILGDFTMRKSGHAKAYLSGLNGNKYLIKGNHDLFLETFGETEGWFKWVKDYDVINHDGIKFVLFHYPIVEWYRFGKGSVHLHGHLHNSKTTAPWDSSKTRVFNVGVDVCDYRPVSIREIIQKANKIPITKRHKHENDFDD